MICPKCGGVLERRIFHDKTYYYCSGCTRGFTEQHLQAIREEVDVTVGFCDKVVENGKSC